MNLKGLKYKFIRKLFNFPIKRKPQRGFIIIQIDGLSYDIFKLALKKNYLPKIKKILEKNYSYKSFLSGIPSNTPYFQKVLFYGDISKYPGFRWYDKRNNKYYSFKLPETAEIEEKKVKEKNFSGILKNGASYYNLFSGDAERNYLVLSKILTKSLSSKISALKLLLIIFLNIPALFKVAFWGIREFYHEICDWLYFYLNNLPQRDFKFFPFLRIFNNVIINEYITQGACVEIICGTPKIYLTYNAYDEASHQRGPESKSALNILKLIDKSVWRIFKLANKKGNIRKYDFFILSDHGQKKAIPFRFVFKKDFKDVIMRYGKNIKVNESKKEISVLPIIEKIRLLSKEKKIPRFIYYLFPYIKYKKLTITQDFGENIKIVNFGVFSQIYFVNFKDRLFFEDINSNFPLLLPFILSHRSISFIIVMDKNRNTLFLGKKGFLKVKTGEILEKSGYFDLNKKYLRELEEISNHEFAGDILIFGNIINGRIINFEGQMSAHGTFYDEEISCFLIFPNNKLSYISKVDYTMSLHNFFKNYYS